MDRDSSVPSPPSPAARELSTTSASTLRHVWTWGSNSNGQLGNGSGTESPVPVEVEGSGGSGFLGNVVSVSGGGSHSLALDSGGHVWAWGYDHSGQLGNGSNADISTPVEVEGAGGTGFLGPMSAISAGGFHSLALQTQSSPTHVSGPRGASQAGDVVTQYAYSDPSHHGDVTSMIGPDGNTWTYTYDTYGDKLTSTDPMGDETSYTYNKIGWLTSQTSPNGNVKGVNPALFTTTYGHDKFGNVTSTTDPLSHTTTRKYDPDQNLISVTDPERQTTRYRYDDANEQIAIMRPDGTVLGTAYNKDGEVTEQIDGAGHATKYGYSSLGYLISTTDPLGRTTKYSYDAAGNRTAVVDAMGERTSDAYDADGELTSITYSDGKTPNVTNVTYNADGQRTSMTDGTGTSTWTYDSLNELTGYTNGAGAGTAYGYDLAGNLTLLTYPNGHQVTETYYAAGRLSTVTDWLKNTTTFGYDHDSNLTTETFPAGTNEVDRYTYDDGDNLIGITDTQGATTLASFEYTRDADKLLASSTITGITAPNETYDYTKLNQLGSVNTQTYAYDKANNITQLANGCALTYDNANELKSSTCGSVNTAFGYNADGDRTTQSPSNGSPTTYTYDQADRLIDYHQGATTAQYMYDGDGLRMSKTADSSAPQQFAWNEAGSLPLLIEDGAVSLVYGPSGLPVEQINSGNVYYYHHDQLGSTRLLTNAGGSVVGTYAYDAYGTMTKRGSAPGVRLGDAGQFFDSESGLMFLPARYYDPGTAQFLRRDALDPVSRRPYGYVNDDPTNGSDPAGNISPLESTSQFTQLARTCAQKGVAGACLAAVFCPDQFHCLAEESQLALLANRLAAQSTQGSTNCREAHEFATYALAAAESAAYYQGGDFWSHVSAAVYDTGSGGSVGAILGTPFVGVGAGAGATVGGLAGFFYGLFTGTSVDVGETVDAISDALQNVYAIP